MKYTAAQYAQTLYELLEKHSKNSKAIVRKFAATLLKNGQAGLAREIARQFTQLSNAHKGITPVSVTAAEKHAVSAAQLEKLLKTRVELTEAIDPNVGAGARIQIGDFQIDNTLARRLSDLRNTITQ